LTFAVLLAAVVAGVLGYVFGEAGRQTVITRTGVAYSSATQAIVHTGGWSYNIPLDVPWTDTQGTLHDGGRPSCLPAYRRASIVFGTVNITLAGATMRSVVWVRC
jgi:hypothetical protein